MFYACLKSKSVRKHTSNTYCYFFIAFLFFSGITQDAISQDTINIIDASHLKQGYWIKYNLSKKNADSKDRLIYEEGRYLNGKKTGLWKQYYDNQALKSEIIYKNNIPFGHAKFYYKNGHTWEEGNWENYKWNGKYKFYYESGQLRYDWNFVNGLRESTQKYYYENGNLNFDGEWKNGEEYGTIKEYNEDGSLKEERVYVNGKFSAEPIKHENIKSPTANFKKGKLEQEKNKNISTFNGTGNHKLYTASGKIKKEGYFMKGVLMNGKSYEYSKEGILQKTNIYKDGKAIQLIEKKSY